MAGGLNTYAYVGGNPLKYIDPFGLYTEVIIWEPYGWGSSSAGHVSGNIDGDNYSWGPGGWDSKYPQASDYANRQTTFRSGAGVELNLTPEQEAQLKACLQRYNPNYDPVFENCGTPFKDCFANLGIGIGYPLFPADIGNNLLDSDASSGTTHYDGPPRGFWDNIKRGDLPDAPWAR